MRSIELFCGTGGLALGLQQAGFRHEAMYEWDNDSCENIRSNIALSTGAVQDWNIVQTDVRLVDYSSFSGKLDLVSGGPPCQPFSLGGKHQANNDKRDMFPEAVRAIRETAPKAFIFENVKGLLRQSFSEYFNYIILQLTYPEITKSEGMTWEEHLHFLKEYDISGKNCGLAYNVKYLLVNAADYGVPQYRHRVFIVGFRSDSNMIWTGVQPTHSQDGLLYSKWVSGEYWEEHNIVRPLETPISDYQIRQLRKKHDEGLILKRWKTVRDAIGDLPDPQNGTMPRGLYNHEYRPGARVYPGHSGSVLDDPSKTIKAGAHGVPGGENMVVLDDGRVRYYTVRESARIQTFPDDYLFCASWTESMRQIGNAVPVKLAKTIGSSVFSQLERW